MCVMVTIFLELCPIQKAWFRVSKLQLIKTRFGREGGRWVPSLLREHEDRLFSKNSTQLLKSIFCASTHNDRNHNFYKVQWKFSCRVGRIERKCISFLMMEERAVFDFETLHDGWKSLIYYDTGTCEECDGSIPVWHIFGIWYISPSRSMSPRHPADSGQQRISLCMKTKPST